MPQDVPIDVVVYFSAGLQFLLLHLCEYESVETPVNDLSFGHFL